MLHIKQIQELLPHRYPFLLVDRVVEVEEGVRCVGVKNVSINEPFFQGHFPGEPIMPGVLVMEAMAQVGGILLMLTSRTKGKLVLFGGAENVRFRRQVRPGDQLVTEAVLLKWRGKTGKVRVVGRVDGAVAAEGEYTFVMGSPEAAVEMNGPGIHPTAIVHPGAKIDPTATIGPHCVIGEGTEIGPGVTLSSQVTIVGWTSIGADCEVSPGAVLGGPPQARRYAGEKTFLRIGERNQIREFVTIHRSTQEGQATEIGNDNLLMAYSHVGHDCRIGSQVLIANNAGLSGHSVVEDYVNVGGFVGFHQYVTIGRLAMLSGYSKINMDVPPYALADGIPARVRGVNTVGLRRQGLSPEVREYIKQALKILYMSGLSMSNGVERVKRELPSVPEVEAILEFVENVRKGYAGRARDPQAQSI